MHLRSRLLPLAIAAFVAGCATVDQLPPEPRRLTAAEGRALTARLLPADLHDRNGWAVDIHAAFATLDLPVTAESVCAAIAVGEQESGLRADPAVPGLAKIAAREIERQRERAGVPKLVLDAALTLPSPTGKTYRERLDAVTTEGQLSAIYEDFIGMVPLGTRLLADRNPVKTGGPMQVGIAYAQAHAVAKPYPYPVATNLRHEVFTRRGGMYFGIAHLLDYPAAYDKLLYRFADFNAGHYASRNAAFQAALVSLTGIPLAQDGDLVRYEGAQAARDAGETELAARTLTPRLRLTHEEIRCDLETGRTQEFDRSLLYTRVFALADAAAGKPTARAVVPQIKLSSPKITRELTTDWFARRVDERHRRCLARAAASTPR
jgi:uncharacterized protein YceK